MKGVFIIPLAAVCLGFGFGQVRGQDLLLECRPLAGENAAPGSWRPGGGEARCAPVRGSAGERGLQFRYACETEPNRTYLLRRQFVCLSNGIPQASMTLSNLLSGDGTTRWVTNEIVAHLDTQEASFRVGPEVLARGPSGQLALAVTRVTLEAYAGGCPGCGSNPEPGRPGLVYGGNELRFGLGRSWHGQPVGELSVSLEHPNPELRQPKGLRLLALPDSVSVVSQDGALRQVGTSQCLVDVLQPNDHSCQIRFYATNALSPNGTPATLFRTNGLNLLVCWTLAQPAGQPGRERPKPGLVVTEASGSLRITNLYWLTANGWALLAGNGLRRETCENRWDATRQVRSELRQTFEPAGNRLVAQTLRTYRLFRWGEALVQEVEGAGAEARTNSYSYYEQPGSASEGRLFEVVRSNGSWRRCEYDSKGRLQAQWSPFGNSDREHYRQGRKLSYEYAPWRGWGDDGERFWLRPRTRTESIGGQGVARSYLLASANQTVLVQCAAASQAPFDGPALCTTKRFYPADTLQPLRLRSVEHPDGTMECFEYNTGPFAETEIHSTGQPDPEHRQIIDGVQELSVLGKVGQVLLRARYDIAPGRTNLLTTQEAFTYSDELQRSHWVSYLDGTSNVVQHGCCGLESSTERDGRLTLYGYDDLKRLQTELRIAGSAEPVTTRFTYDAANRLVSRLRIGKSGRASVPLGGTAYDSAGRRLFETNGLGGVTAFTYGADAEGRPTVSSRYPDGGTRIEAYNRDGTLHQLSGTAVHGLRYEYGVAESGQLVTRETKLTESGQPSGEWVATYTDRLGREVKTEFADGALSRSSYNLQGQLSAQQDPDGVLTLYGYNVRGERDTEAVRTDATNRSQTIDYNGSDRVTRTVTEVRLDPELNAAVERRRKYVWGEFNSGRSNLVATLERSMDGLRSWRTLWDHGVAVTHRSELVPAVDGGRDRYEYAPDGSWLYYRYRYGRLELLQDRDSFGGTNAQRSFRYDEHDRLWQEVDPRTGTLTYAYNAADLVATQSSLAPGAGQHPRTTTNQYNPMLQVTNVALPGGRHIATEYLPTGEIRRRQGWQVYPVEYTCDYAGRVKTLTTWRSQADPGTATVTVWNYDVHRGWLDSKRFPDGTGPSYQHTPAGRLRSRTWARETAPGSGVRVQTAYGYSPAGDLASVSYNDLDTPRVQYTLDRRGRVVRVTQDTPGNPQLTSTTSLSYNLQGQTVSETHSNGLLAGLSLSSGYDSFLRRTNLTLSSPGAVLHSVAYNYESGARLKSVSQPAADGSEASASYAYEPNAALVQQIEFREGKTTRLLSTRRHDTQDRPLAVADAPSGSPAMTYDYVYDEADQPARVTLTDCSYWGFDYDALGQLRHASKYASEQKPLAGQQFEYQFDQRGDPLRGGGATGSPPPLSGTRLSGPHTFEGYDADGNLTNDGQWTFTWDAENRLLRQVANATARPRQRLDLAYDWKGRRIQKTVSDWNPRRHQFEPARRLSFAYDDWNLIAVLGAEHTLLTSFAWGVELVSGGAAERGGGAGGLVIIRQHAAGPGPGKPGARQPGPATRSAFLPATYFAAFDGTGNLVGLVNARDGKSAAHYAYGPFGQDLPARVAGATNAVFRFSTRYQDEESGLLYCGYRYYNPRTGRWLSREPLHEYAFWKRKNDAFELPDAPGDRTLYGTGDYVYVRNAPVGNIDWLGLASSCDQAVQKALKRRGSRKLLEKFAAAGAVPPSITGADAETYCSFPGYLGDYDCPNRQGKICCLNVSGDAEVERTVRHELVHALDCCHNGLATCHDHICSEVVAYYLADCERFVNRMDCALGQMRASMSGDRACAPASAALSESSAWNCLREWKAREGLR